MPLCKFCSKEFEPANKTNRKAQEYCSKRCRNYYHQFNYLSKIRKRTETGIIEEDKEAVDLTHTIDR